MYIKKHLQAPGPAGVLRHGTGEANYLKVAKMYLAMAFASASGTAFASNLVIPGPGLRILATMSFSDLIPLAASDFWLSVFFALIMLPPFGCQAAQCWLNFALASTFASAKAGATITDIDNTVTIATTTFFI